MDNDPQSYEEQQLQIILMNELRKQLLQEERNLKESQDMEYQESLKKDKSIEEISIEEISIEEMRKIRLQRFDK